MCITKDVKELSITKNIEKKKNELLTTFKDLYSDVYWYISNIKIF